MYLERPFSEWVYILSFMQQGVSYRILGREYLMAFSEVAVFGLEDAVDFYFGWASCASEL